LRFHDETTDTDLAFEIDHWDPSGESDVWVRVPLIHARSIADRVLVFYGADAAGIDAPASVWSDYDLVFHADGLVDSSGHGTPEVASATMPTAVTGMIGNAAGFRGASERIDMT